MEVCTSNNELALFLKEYKGIKKGFVPTMGALHEGHLSLIKMAVEHSDVVISSVFVNPAQFNDAKDLANYPRMPEKDAAMLGKAGCNCLYLPPVSEVYPSDYVPLKMDFGKMEQVMEGQYRPGHFKGVAAVVHRLFSLVQPDEAFFGEKDFQQLAIIKAMSAKMHPEINITGCATIREKDGLAMSSRNLLLTHDQRKEAPVIYKALDLAEQWLKSEKVETVMQMVEDYIHKNSHFTVQYFEIVHPLTLQRVTENTRVQGMRGCIAVLTGGPRLIDNMEFSV